MIDPQPFRPQFVNTMMNFVDQAITNSKEVIDREYFPKEPGYQYNLGEGIGSILLIPGQMAANYYQAKRNQNTLSKVISIALAFFTAPLTLTGLGLKKLCSFLPHTPVTATDEIFGRTDPETIDHVYDLTEIFADIAKDIDYVALSGTALGALRHGKGMIPWDDDSDFALKEEDKRRFDELIPQFKARGVEVTYHPNLKTYQFNFTQEELRRRGYKEQIHIDAFLTCLDETRTKWVLASEQHRHNFPNDYMTVEERAQVKEKDFGSPSKKFKMKCLRKKAAESYLKRAYGENCLKYGIKTHNHISFNIFNIISFSLPLPVMNRVYVPLTTIGVPASGNKWT